MESEISTKAIPENHDGQVKEDDDEVSYRKVFSQTIHLEGTWVWVGSRCQAKYLKIIKHWLKLYILKKIFKRYQTKFNLNYKVQL